MAGRRSGKRRLLKDAGIVALIVVGYDLYKSHTNGPRPVRKSSSGS